MKTKFLILFILTLFTQNYFAQAKLPVIKANSKEVDIKADGKLMKKVWGIAPEEKLDVYITNAKNVTFYTDIDSISFKIDPKVGKYDFVIRLNGKEAKTQIKYELSRLDILKKADLYNYSDNRFVPKFTYQSADHPDLVKVRKDLKLDSIAGSGAELSKIFNLMHWVHNLVKHDGRGTMANPTLQNAIDLIKICKAENRGVNCRMLSTILNDCYLAMGIKSRHVTCMQKESEFDDAHVINMVFSTELNKWIWIDPTFDAYVMDEKGNLLGIEEVRERLTKDQPLILNADANWNRELTYNKEYYLETYMAKNLYRLQSPAVSEYDLETWKTGKKIDYVELLPLDGIEQTPQKTEKTYKNSQVTLTFFKTNNPDMFYSKS